jgi:4'-phosphopantetheinyl transferase
VWRADLAAVGDGPSELLDDGERARAARMIRGGDRLLWTRARGVLRALLGRYLQTDPAMLRFASGTHGKPALADHERLSFNLSHSGQIALYALTDTGAVGIDVEVARRSRDVLALAVRAFGAAQAERLAAVEPPLREREFLRLWTRREAALKCRGTGIGCSPTGEIEPRILELDVGSSAAAAVALECPTRELRQWDWLPYVASPESPAGSQRVDGK